MQKALINILKIYRMLISPILGQHCRFFPSCSSYALEAIEIHGAWRGLRLASSRVGRCHPWHPGGVDPVPNSGDKH
ncbi:MAG TPA: membrane protein insertion efficiency factor YidD [Acidiferrobacteraceae bacterium]|nr:membrane protein insertion efficiency factor YidD [Acidiferrobacteraceae bacterium]